ncbi:apolipoprotein N-acyltransferase [Candidatus Pelagibacter sp.]|nr:apolipoprotein N-acyltransferase [Candidatus Pelagibacter sp.]
MNIIFENKAFLFLICLLLGILTSFSLPPYNLFFINFLTLPLLLYILVNYINKKTISFFVGWIFGFGYFISNLYWLTNSLTFDVNFKFIIPFALILIPLFLGIFYGLATFLCNLFNLKNKISSILIFSIFFGGIEFLRSFTFGGFPWNLLVFSLSNNSNSLQILSYIGTYSLNLLSITIFLLPLTLFLKYKILSKFLILSVGLILVVANILYGYLNIKNFEKKKYDNLNSIIRVISPNIPIERFLKNQDTEKSINELISLSDPSSLKKTIFVYPEGIITSIYLKDLKFFKKIFKENYNINHKVIFGINSINQNKVYNSLIVLNNESDLLYKYNKNKLVPFGEFLPFENFFKRIGLKKITQGYQSFSADDKREIFEINKIKFIPLICYEIIYSGKINPNKNYYDFILNISEDGWFGKSIGPKQHLSHSIFRSIEEGKNVIRSTNNGISAFIDPKGQIIKQISEKGYFDVNKIRRVDKTYFTKQGNKIFFYFVLIYTTFIVILKIREN